MLNQKATLYGGTELVQRCRGEAIKMRYSQVACWPVDGAVDPRQGSKGLQRSARCVEPTDCQPRLVIDVVIDLEQTLVIGIVHGKRPNILAVSRVRFRDKIIQDT